MVLVRLIVGLLKGVVLGALVGYGLAAAGFVVAGPVVAYLVAALLGVLVAAVAGKAIWAKGAKVEVGMKAAAALLIAPGLLYVVRRWLGVELPFDLNDMVGLGPTKASLGMLSLTSFPLVAAILAGFFEADNDPGAVEESSKGASAATAAKGRIAEPDGAAELAGLDTHEDAEPRRARK